MEKDKIPSLQQRVVRGYLFAFIYLGGYFTFLFVSRVFLYRLLTTSDFGIYNVALAFIGTINTIGGLGIPAALVQREGDEQTIISTGATLIMTTVSIALCILALFSNTIAKTYQESNLIPIIILLCVTTIAGLGGVPVRALARRRLEYQRLYLVMLLKDISVGAVALIFAFSGYGFWSLVYGRAVSDIFSLILSLTYLHKPFNLRFTKYFNPKKFSKQTAKELYKVGFGLFLTAVTIQLLKDLVQMFGGYLLNIEAVGILSAVLFFIQFFEMFIQQISEVTFSAFSRVQRDYSVIQIGITKYLRYSSLIIIPYFIFLAIVGEDLIEIALGKTWVPPPGVLLALSLTVLIFPFGYLGSAIFKSLGESRSLVMVNSARILTFILVSLALVSSFGLLGLSIGILAQHIAQIGFIIMLRGRFYFLKHMQTRYKNTVAAAILMGLCMLYLRNWIHGFFSLGIIGVIGLGIFYTGLYLIEGKIFLNDIQELFRLVTMRKN